MGYLSRKMQKWFRRGKAPSDEVDGAQTNLADYVISKDVMANADFQRRRVVYKDAAVQALVNRFPPYTGNHAEEDAGMPVRLRNGAAAILAQSPVTGHLIPLFISPYKDREWIEGFISKIGKVTDHQKLRKVKWPERTDPKLQPKLQAIFRELGFVPDERAFDPKACEKFGRKTGESVVLKWYQKCPGAYLIYSQQRGLLVFHGTGTGKTCMASNAIECFIRYSQAEDAMNLSGRKQQGRPRVFVVLPPRKSLDENMRDSLANACPTIIRERIEAARKKGSKVDMANRIINRHVTIISYISLAHRLKKGLESLEGAVLLMDEVHNFLDAKPQFAKEYKYLLERVRATKNCKIMLMTATPIYNSLSDLTRLLNVIRRDTEDSLPQDDVGFLKRYFVGSSLKRDLFRKDVLGNVSYINLENDLSYFAKKVVVKPLVTHVSDDHYEKWSKSKKADEHKYKLSQTVSAHELVVSENKAFKNRETGYFKHSSAVNNTPLTYRSHGKWPAKFGVVRDMLARHPKTKIFVYSRHKAQGANALGTYLENELGWDRMSNNKQDHGANAPSYYNPLGRALSQPNANVKDLLARQVKKPYQGFIVLNNATSQTESKRALSLFNHAQNLDGRACRVFIGDEAYSEGVSLMACSVVVCMEPPYSFQNFQQIVARAVRFCSHQALPRPWTVNVYTLVSEKDETHLMTDALLLNYSEENQKLLQQVIDAVREGSIEYGFKPDAGSGGILTQPRLLSRQRQQFGFWKSLVDILHRREA